MNTYLLYLVVLCGAGALLMSVIYARFRVGLTSKMFAIIIPAEIIIAELSFVLGGEGAPASLLVTLVPLGVGAAVVAMLWIYRITIQPLAPLTAVMTHIAVQRDLRTLPPISNRADEIHSIQSAFHTMTENLRAILAELQQGVAQLPILG